MNSRGPLFLAQDVVRQASAFFFAVGCFCSLQAQPLMLDTLIPIQTSTSLSSGNSHTLSVLLRQTLMTHPSLAARDSERGAARAEVQAAHWLYWPTPALGLEQSDRPAMLGGDRQVRVVSLSQPVWTGGRLDATLAQAQAGLAVVDALYQERRRELALELIQAHGDGVAAQGRVQAWQSGLEVTEKLLGLVQRRADEGLSTQSDVSLAQSRRSAVLAERELARSQQDAARQKLQSLSGETLHAPLSPAGKPAKLQSYTASLSSEALQSLDMTAHAADPTLARLQAEVQQLQAESTKARASLWPTLQLRIEQRQGNSNGHSQRVMLGLESQWGAGLANLSAIQASQQRLMARRSDIQARERRLTEQVQSDWQLLRATEARLKTLADAVGSSEVVAESWGRQFLAGKKSWQDVMNAAREAIQTQIQLFDAQAVADVTSWRLAVLTLGLDEVARQSATEVGR
jgi:adhesin transport system outer membrane protein